VKYLFLLALLVAPCSAFYVRINNTITATNEVNLYVNGVLLDTIRVPGASTTGNTSILCGPYSDHLTGLFKASYGFTPPLYTETTGTDVSTWSDGALVIVRMQGGGFGTIALSYGLGASAPDTWETLLEYFLYGFALVAIWELGGMGLRMLRSLGTNHVSGDI